MTNRFGLDRNQITSELQEIYPNQKFETYSDRQLADLHESTFSEEK